MLQVMFDIDGTLLASDHFDGQFYQQAVFEVVGHPLDTDWTRYEHVSDSGILDQHLRDLGLGSNRDAIEADVKRRFTAKIAQYLDLEPARPIAGAVEFIRRLRGIEALRLCIATGGWRGPRRFWTASRKRESADGKIVGEGRLDDH